MKSLGNKLVVRYGSLTGPWRAYWWFVAVGFVLLAAGVFVLREMDHPWEGAAGLKTRQGKDFGPAEYTQVYLFWAGVHVAILWGVVLATSCWWWRWSIWSEVRKPEELFRPGRAGWIGIVLVLVVAAWIRVPQTGRFVLRDEQDVLRQTTHGFFEMDADTNKPVFVEKGWLDAFFDNSKGNNHVLLSVTMKGCLDLWRAATGAGQEFYSVRAMRVPVLIAGLGSIFALWWLLHLFALPRAALLTAFLTAVHPMHIEYSVQARGYAFVMLSAILAAGFALLALRRSRWRYWIGFGASLFMILYAYFGALYFVVAMGVAVGGVIVSRLVWQRDAHPEALAQVVRLGVVGIIAGGLWWVLVLSPLVQLRDMWGGTGWENPLGPEFPFIVYTQYTGGAMFANDLHAFQDETGKGVASFLATQFVKREPVYSLLMLVLVPVLAGMGFARIWRAAIEARIWLVASLGAACAAYAHHRFFLHHVFFYWYMIYALPPLLAMMGTGLDGAGVWLGRVGGAAPKRQLIASGVAVVFFLLFLWQTAPGKRGRCAQLRGLEFFDGTDHPQYTRGRSVWVNYPEGRTIRWPADEVVPDEFPW